MADVFISYNRKDRAEARVIAEAIAAKGYEVWWDVDLLPGDKFADEIKAVIEKAKAAVVLWSARSVVSNFVRAEAQVALQRGILVPVALDAAEVPLPFNNLHILDLQDWDRTPNDQRLQPLIAAIAQRTAQAPQEIADLSRINRILQKPSIEVDYWKSVSERDPQDVEEYEAYLSKYGEDAQFADIARIRISKLRREKTRTWPKIARFVAAATAVVTLIAGVVGLFKKTEQPPYSPRPPIPGGSSAILAKCNELTNLVVEGVSGRPSALEYSPGCGDEVVHGERYTLKVKHKDAVRASFYYHANSIWQSGREYNDSGPGLITGDYVTIDIPVNAARPHDEIFWYAELTNNAGQTRTPQMQFHVTAGVPPQRRVPTSAPLPQPGQPKSSAQESATPSIGLGFQVFVSSQYATQWTEYDPFHYRYEVRRGSVTVKDDAGRVLRDCTSESWTSFGAGKLNLFACGSGATLFIVQLP